MKDLLDPRRMHRIDECWHAYELGLVSLVYQQAGVVLTLEGPASIIRDNDGAPICVSLRTEKQVSSVPWHQVVRIDREVT